MEFDMMECTESLPIDIIIDILLRLPAKPLIRFKCVSTSWYHLLNDPSFAKRHLERSLATQPNLFFAYTDPILKLADFDTFDNPIDLDYPFKYNQHENIGGGTIKGCSNGLLCISSYEYYDCSAVALFNPTTRTYKLIPYVPRPSHVAHCKPIVHYGFGYDSVSDDYKFVRIFECYDKENGTYPYSDVMVYSLKNDSWVKVADEVSNRFLSKTRRSDGVLLNGVLHWVIDGERDHPPLPVVSFNLSTHTFGEVPMPEIDQFSYCYNHVAVLDGCLCILVNYLEHYEIWVMKEYGVAESWTKLLLVMKAQWVDALERIVCYTKNRKELLVELCLHRITTIDMESAVIQDVKALGNPSRTWDAHVCVENLLMLSDSCYFPENEQEEEYITRRGRTWRRRNKRKLQSAAV